MGDPSTLRFVPDDSSTVPIDWSKVPEASKKFFLDGWGYDWEKEEKRALPATIGDLAKMFNESKFFGYLETKRCTLLLDISEFGLAPSGVAGQGTTGALPVGPRFYMKYLEELWFVLFMPGERDGILGNSAKVRANNGYEEDDEVMATEEAAMAQAFDAKLEEEVQSRWGIVDQETGWLRGVVASEES